jgi:two-component system response regulator FimZ (fimbrial Z protein)
MTHKPHTEKLSERELEIISLVSTGLTSIEIAAKLYLSHHTVFTHRRNILRKTGAPNIITVVAMYIGQKHFITNTAA